MRKALIHGSTEQFEELKLLFPRSCAQSALSHTECRLFVTAFDRQTAEMTCTRGLPYRGSVAACLFILDTTSRSRHSAIDNNGPGYQSPSQQPPAFRSTATDLLVCAQGTGRPGPRLRRQVLTDHLCLRVSYPFTSDEFHPSFPIRSSTWSSIMSLSALLSHERRR